MNKLLPTILLAGLTGWAATPAQARHHDHEALAALGGFIGGVIVGSAIDHDRPPSPPPVCVIPRHEIGGRVVIASGHRPHGYWDWVTVRVWVPGRWVQSWDRHGHRVRFFQAGHYEHRRERVWVEARGRHRYRD